MDLVGERLPGSVLIDLVALGDGLGHGLVVVRGAGRPGQDRSLVERQRRIGHDQLGVDLHLRAEPGAAGARAVRRVEREHPRLQLGHARAALQAGETLGEGADIAGAAEVLPVAGGRDHLDLHDPLGQPHGRLDRVGQPAAQVVAHAQAVDHDGDVVLVALVEGDLLLEAAHLAVDLHPGVALRAQVLEELSVLTLAPADHRGQDHEPRALLEGHDLVDDLLGRLGGDGVAAGGTVRTPDPRPQQAQVVVDLGDRAHRRARVARGRLLVDRDGRGQPLDRIDVGLVHLAKELARVGRQRLDVAALALGVDGVEGEAGLARSPRAP